MFDPTLIADHTLLATLQEMKIPSQGTNLFLVMSLMLMLLNLLNLLTQHTQNRTVIFGDSITRRIGVRDFNRELDTGHAKIITCAGAISK